MITRDKVTEIFCIIDECDKKLDGELKRNLRLTQPEWQWKTLQKS